MVPFISEREVKMQIKKIDSTITGSLDKNALASLTQCRKLFWLKMKETYIDDVDHYEVISSISEKDILAQLEKWYKSTLSCQIPLAH